MALGCQRPSLLTTSRLVGLELLTSCIDAGPTGFLELGNAAGKQTTQLRRASNARGGCVTASLIAVTPGPVLGCGRRKTPRNFRRQPRDWRRSS